MGIVDHIEKYLGPVEQVWKDKKSKPNFHVASFKDSPCEGSRTFITVGISRHILGLTKTKDIRHEFICTVDESASLELMASFLVYIGQKVINRHKAILRGDVIPFSDEARMEMGFHGVYCAEPLYFDEGFVEFDLISPPVIIVWVIPIYKNEYEFIRHNGWRKFEDILVEKDPELCSLVREPVIDWEICDCSSKKLK